MPFVQGLVKAQGRLKLPKDCRREWRELKARRPGLFIGQGGRKGLLPDVMASQLGMSDTELLEALWREIGTSKVARGAEAQLAAAEAAGAEAARLASEAYDRAELRRRGVYLQQVRDGWQATLRGVVVAECQDGKALEAFLEDLGFMVVAERGQYVDCETGDFEPFLTGRVEVLPGVSSADQEHSGRDSTGVAA